MKLLKSRLVLSLVFVVGSLLTLPAHAWPEVDHMNMCGAASKVNRAYGGSFKGWAARDHYVNQVRRSGYYFRSNCPKTKAPVKKASTKKVVKKVATKTAKKKTVKIARSNKAKSFKRKVKYDMHADCVRVDGMNGSGPAVRVVRRR